MTTYILPEHEDIIRARAYAIWEEEGRPDGRHEIHWQRAVAELEAAHETPVASRVVRTLQVKPVSSTVYKTSTLVVAVEDVSLISGIGAKMEKQLEAEGITKLSQIATMSDATLAKLDEKLGLKGRSVREEWITQARELIAGQAPRAKVDQAKLHSVN
jgi:predicted flap endonuclease-1-like 5' DNA nuclease